MNSFFAVEAKKVGEGFCYKKLNPKTGECKAKMKLKQQKVDCCSNGGAGWSARRKDRTECEPCKTSKEGILHITFMSLYMGLESELDCKEICLTKMCYKLLRSSLELLVLIKADAK